MNYAPDIGFHGAVSLDVREPHVQREPSLTLCDLTNFGYWSGFLSNNVFRQLVLTSAFQRLAARAESDSGVSIRVSTYTVWLEAGEVPSARPDWHIDRVGALRRDGAEELVDLRDPFKFPSYILTSVFVPEDPHAVGFADEVSTEFLLSPISGTSPEYWANMNHMHQDIDTAFAKNSSLRTIRAGDRMLMSFSPRTVHRPGQTSVPGWRYLMRVGLYTTLEPCSPYLDHFVFFNPAWHSVSGDVKYRTVGCKSSLQEPAKRSVSLLRSEERRQAMKFVEESALSIQGHEGIRAVEQLVAEATNKGMSQIVPCVQGARGE